MSEKSESSGGEKATGIPKPSGIKPPASVIPKVNRICGHDKKPDLPTAATPSKTSGVSSSASPDFYEATGRRSSSDHGNDLTTDTDSFMIGQRVYVGGVRSGRITFIGEVHFAPGEWAGIVLDEPEGKNDGAVSGKRYFQCEPKKGIFSRLTRLTREPIASEGLSSMETSYRSMISPGRSGTTSPTSTYSVTSASKTPLTASKFSTVPEVNDRVIVKSATGSRAGILRYKGEPQFASGVWCGIEFEEAIGKNDGTVGGHRYFKCDSNHGLFVPESKVALSPLARKSRLSRANSQESLTSNLTVGSMTSTNTSKLRSSAVQKRLSSLNKTPSFTSTPKPSFSLQDILREKTNHIEQLMKERETDREEMSAQSVLFQKNISLYKEKVTLLHHQLEEERKKSEDLQFTIDEAAILAEDSDGALKKYKDRITQLEKEIKRSNAQAGGDCVPPAISTEEIDRLHKEIEETANKLRAADELKNTFEKEIQSLHEIMAEMKNDLEIKTSGSNASEQCLKDELTYLEKRVNDLEIELGEKAKTIELQDIQLKKSEESINQVIAEHKNLIAKEKDTELIRFNEKESLLNERLEQLEKSLNERSDAFIKKDNELKSLQNVFASIEIEFSDLQKTSEKQLEELNEKSEAKYQIEKKLDVHLKEISAMRAEIESYQSLTKNSDQSIQKSFEIQENLKQQIAELLESQVKLKTDVATKDARLIELAVVEEEIKNINQLLVEKDSAIEKWIKDFNELEANSKMNLQETIEGKEVVIDELMAAKKTTEEALEKLKTELKDKVNHLEKSEKNAALLNELKTSLGEKLSSREAELKEATTKLSKLERDDAEKTSQFEKLNKSLDDITKKLQEAEILAKKLQDDKHILEVDKNDLNRKLGANEEKIAQLTEQKSQLQQDAESAKSSSLDINSELSKLNNLLKEKQAAFEAFQDEADTLKLNLQRRVDELEQQNGLFEQQCSKLKNEMDALQTQKIESENQLNQELQNIKTTCEEERSELSRELIKLQSKFDAEKIQLNREKKELQEALEKSREELEGKIRILELSIEDLNTSREALKNQYEDKLAISQAKLTKQEEDLANVLEQQTLSLAGTEEKVKILDDIQAKCYQQEQKIADLSHQLENETSIKEKLEANNVVSQLKFREMEDEQVDLVNREEKLKNEQEELKRNIEQLNSLRISLDEKLTLEKKDSELFKIASEEKVGQMVTKINELQQTISSKELEKDVIIEKLHLREDEVVQLQAAVKNLEGKLENESNDTQRLLKGKDEELLKTVTECSSKDNLIADLKTNLENIKACLNSKNTETESSTDLVQKLNETISSRDFTIEELQLKVYSIEKANKEIEDQLKNIMAARNQMSKESESRISDLMEQVTLLEQVKEKEVGELSSKLNLVQSELSGYENSAESSKANLKSFQQRENELLLKIKDLELRETELMLLNQSMNRKVEELETLKGVSRTGDAYDQEMQAHVEFLNSIISDMHKKNLKLTQKVEALGLEASSLDQTANGLDLDFLIKKKPAPRLYCDICEEFDGHDTEDCPTQGSEADMPPPKQNKKERKLPPPRKYCDHCEVFDKHETEECPNPDDETF